MWQMSGNNRAEVKLIHFCQLHFQYSRIGNGKRFAESMTLLHVFRGDFSRCR